MSNLTNGVLSEVVLFYAFFLAAEIKQPKHTAGRQNFRPAGCVYFEGLFYL